jgi:uncharacterized coiled-coil protein SlyX
MSNRKQSQTSVLQGRIADLEAQVAEQNGVVDNAEAAVADAYGEGRDAKAELSALSEAKNTLSGMVKALRDLEARLVDISAQENTSRRNELAAEARKRYKDSMKVVLKALSPLRGALNKVMPSGVAEKAVSDLDKHVRRVVWEHINEQFSSDYLEYVPALVGDAPERDDRGRRLDQRARIEYPSQSTPAPDYAAMAEQEARTANARRRGSWVTNR